MVGKHKNKTRIMLENIRKLYTSLNKRNRENVVKAIADRYRLAEITIRQHYLISLDIKEERQEPILTILQKAHFEQSRESKELSEL